MCRPLVAMPTSLLINTNFAASFVPKYSCNQFHRFNKSHELSTWWNKDSLCRDSHGIAVGDVTRYWTTHQATVTGKLLTWGFRKVVKYIMWAKPNYTRYVVRRTFLLARYCLMRKTLYLRNKEGINVRIAKKNYWKHDTACCANTYR